MDEQRLQRFAATIASSLVDMRQSKDTYVAFLGDFQIGPNDAHDIVHQRVEIARGILRASLLTAVKVLEGK